MAQGINKIHPRNIIKSSFDGTMYQYNGYEWVRCEPTKVYQSETEWEYKRPIKLHKAYEILSPSEYTDTDIIEGDYLAIYRTNYNEILGSEMLNDENRWSKSKAILKDDDSNKRATVALMQNRSIKMPENREYCYSMSNVKSPKILEHYISQQFIAHPSTNGVNLQYFCLSTFAKPIPSKDSSKVGLSFYIPRYDIGLCCKYDVNSIEGYSNWEQLTADLFVATKTLPASSLFYINEAGTTVSNTTFANSSAGIQLYQRRFEDGTVDYFFRPYIITQIKCYGACLAKIVQLNHNGDWKFAENEIQYGNYFSGIQLEMNNIALTKPTRYITTDDKRAFKRTLQNVYMYERNAWVDRSDKKIYYLFDVVEKHKETINEHDEKIQYTTIEESKPNIPYPQELDIALVNSLVVFSKDNNYVSEESISGVKLGNNYREDDPLYTIYYDVYDNVYKIKVPDDRNPENTEYVELKTYSENTNNRIITKSMIYNQGYFETFYEKSNYRPRFRFGFNTGGNYNFWKGKYLKHNQH